MSTESIYWEAVTHRKYAPVSERIAEGQESVFWSDGQGGYKTAEVPQGVEPSTVINHPETYSTTHLPASEYKHIDFFGTDGQITREIKLSSNESYLVGCESGGTAASQAFATFKEMEVIINVPTNGHTSEYTSQQSKLGKFVSRFGGSSRSTASAAPAVSKKFALIERRKPMGRASVWGAAGGRNAIESDDEGDGSTPVPWEPIS